MAIEPTRSVDFNVVSIQKRPVKTGRFLFLPSEVVQCIFLSHSMQYNSVPVSLNGIAFSASRRRRLIQFEAGASGWALN